MKNPELKKIAWIDCIFLPLEETYTLTSSIRINAGSDYETEEEAWISHFLEHLSFKGWKKWDNPNDLRNTVMDIGWYFNAATGDCSTRYYIKSPHKTANLQLDILSDMVVNTIYKEDEIDKERWVILQEIKKSRDNPTRETFFQWREFFLWKNNFSRQTLWYEENIKRFTKQEFLNYKKHLYTKDNIVITIAWKIEDQKFMEEKLQQNFSWLPEKKTRERPQFKRELSNKHIKHIEKWLNQTRIAIFIPGVEIISKDFFACSLLTKIIERNIFKTIREELWLCYDITVNLISLDNYGFFLVETWIHPNKMELAIEKINEVIDSILTNWINEDEIIRSKNGKIWRILTDYESPLWLANFYSSKYLTFKKLITLEKWVSNYEKIKKKDIDKVLPLLEKNKRYTFYIK